MTDLAGLRRDLDAEQQVLDDIVAVLDDAGWALPTPSPGWTVADQIGHLTYFDRAAATAITDPPAFAASGQALYAAALDPVLNKDAFIVPGLGDAGDRQFDTLG